jgi:hypothetical protein
MNAERIVRIVAGGFILLSLALGAEASPLFVSKYFLLFTAFVGLNLFQSGFTQICPLNNILARFGVKGGCDTLQRSGRLREQPPCSPSRAGRIRAPSRGSSC